MSIKNKNERFESVDEFYDNLERGGEIEFQYKGKHYAITHSSKGIHLIEAYNNESERIFKTPEDLGEYKVFGEKIKDIITKADVHFRCF